jgi:hypothetical protein
VVLRGPLSGSILNQHATRRMALCAVASPAALPTKCAENPPVIEQDDGSLVVRSFLFSWLNAFAARRKMPCCQVSYCAGEGGGWE